MSQPEPEADGRRADPVGECLDRRLETSVSEATFEAFATAVEDSPYHSKRAALRDLIAAFVDAHADEDPAPRADGGNVHATAVNDIVRAQRRVAEDNDTVPEGHEWADGGEE